MDQTTDLKDVAGLPGVWRIHFLLTCDGGVDTYLHHFNLKCESFHKHFIDFVHVYEGLCFASVVVQRCWNRLLLSTSASSGLLREPPWQMWEPLRGSCTQICFRWQNLQPDPPWRYNIELLEAGRTTVESAHLLTASFGKNNCPVLVLLNLMPTWEKKKKSHNWS